MVTIKFILKNKPLADGSHRVAMRLIKNRQKKVISLSMKCSKESFDLEQGEFKRGYAGYKKRNNKLEDYEEKAKNVLHHLETKVGGFTLEDFQNIFCGNKNEKTSLWRFFDRKIESTLLKPKTRKAYRDTKASLKKFESKSLFPEDVTPEFLEGYATHLRNRGSNDGGIRFFLRHLKSVLYMAYKTNKDRSFDNPFQGFQVSRFKGQPSKRALTTMEMKAFKQVNLDKRPDLIRSYDIAMFTFYCGGINFVDILSLRKENVVGSTLRYVRAKTSHSFVVELLPPALSIVNKYNNENSGYIFPFLKDEDLTPEQFESRRHRHISRYNRDLKKIAELAGIKGNITSYVIRHTYPTFLRNNSISTDVISELMGHSDVRVTKVYLKEFPDEVINKAHRKTLEL
jgi:site-specific recombinase XerD